MKVFVQYALNDSGKGKFLSRLIPALKKIGVECRFKEKGCDVCLGISKWRGKTKLPKVLRVDGVHLEPGHEGQNHAIKKSIQSADAVIFQSRFAQSKVKEVLGVKPKKEFVIYNGANPKDYEIELIEGSNNFYNILISGKWERNGKPRKQKGLKAALEHAYHRVRMDGCTRVWVVGETQEKSHHKRVRMEGRYTEDEMRHALAICDEMIFMPEYDWCPNAVVEAKVAGLKLTLSNHPPMIELLEVPREKLFIDNIAKEYKRAISSVLR